MPTNPQLEIAFCADRNMLAALHVADKSVVQNFTGIPRLLVLSDELGSADIDLCIKRFLILVRNMGSIFGCREVLKDKTLFPLYDRDVFLPKGGGGV